MNDRETSVAELRRIMADFVARRDWEPFHDVKNLSASIAIEAAELMEHFQWLRSEQLDEALEDGGLRDAVRDELADILAYVLSFANQTGIDLSSALAAKMKKNEQKYPEDEFKGRSR